MDKATKQFDFRKVKDSMNEGWVKSWRKMTKHWIWKFKEPFDRRSAWQYIIFNAYHTEDKTMCNGELINIERGQFPTSIRELSEAWMWSTGKVRRFLDALESDNMVKCLRIKSGTLLTVVNYGIYQGERDTNETVTKQQRDTDEHIDETETERSRNIDDTVMEHKRRIKEYKELKKEDILTTFNKIDYQTFIQQIIDKWNTLFEFGLKPIKKIGKGTKVYEQLCARIREYGIDEVLLAVDMIKDSDFLLGKVTNFVITIDWFSRPNNFQKIYNGNYNGGKNDAGRKDTGDKGYIQRYIESGGQIDFKNF